jgi:hypothetical protein
MEGSIILMLKNMLINSIVLYIIPSADASYECSKGKIIKVYNSYSIIVTDLEDNHQYDLRAIDIIKFDKYNIIKKKLLNSIK